MNAMYEEVFGKFAKIGDKYYPVMAMYNHVMLDNRKLFKIARIIYCDEYWTFHSRDLVSELYSITEIPIDIARSLYNYYLEKTNSGFVIKEKLIDKCQDYLVDKVESHIYSCRTANTNIFCKKWPQREEYLKELRDIEDNMDQLYILRTDFYGD